MTNEATSAVLQPDIQSIAGQKIKVTPTDGKILIRRADSLRKIGSIILPYGERLDVQIGSVLAIGTNAKGVKVGHDVLFVRVSGRAIEDREMKTTDGSKVSVLKRQEILAVVDSVTGLEPVDDRILIRRESGLKQYASGIIAFNEQSLSICVSDVLKIGPDVKQIPVGDRVVHAKVRGVKIDDPELCSKFGDRLCLIREPECELVIEGAEDVRIDGEAELGV